MILDTIIYVFWGVLRMLIGLLPNMSILPQTFHDAWEWFAEFTGHMLFIFPASDTILNILSLVWTIELTFLLFWMFSTVWKWLRG